LPSFTGCAPLGIRIAMDDFGTGYSSLTYLQCFPFDKIKIDRSFVKDVTANAGSLNIVRAVAALANGMGMTATPKAWKRGSNSTGHGRGLYRNAGIPVQPAIAGTRDRAVVLLGKRRPQGAWQDRGGLT